MIYPVYPVHPVKKIKKGNSYMFKLLITILIIFSLFQQEANAKELKVGFIYVTPAQDAGWSHSHDLGRQLIDQMPEVTTTFVESISENEYVETVLLHMARNNDLIFATSYGYMDSVRKVAPQFPNIIFMHASGYLRSGNVGTYFGRIYQARYLTGIVAGAMTKTNIIGYVAAYPIPEVIRGINAFTIGVLESNPEARVYVQWTKSWHNVEKERLVTNELMDMKADVIAQHQDSPTVQIEAQKRGVYSIGYNQDMSSFAPRAHLTAAVWNWGVVYKYIVQKILAGDWKSEDIWWGLKQGLVDIAPFGPMVPEEVRKKVLQKKKDIISSKNFVFAGPVLDEKGNIRIRKGKKATDKELLSMNWFAKGVIGTTNPE